MSSEYSLPDHSPINRANFPWAGGLLNTPEFYASRLWEFPWAITEAKLEQGLYCADIGCGQTPFTIYLKEIGGCQVCGFDPDYREEDEGYVSFGVSKAFLAQTGIEFVRAGVENLDAPDNAFDRVFCISVLEHVPPAGQLAGLREIARVLKPGGLALISVDVNLKKRIVNPLWLAWESGLAFSGTVDLLMPQQRFGIFHDQEQPADVFGLVLEKSDRVIDSDYLGNEAVDVVRAPYLRDTYPPEWSGQHDAGSAQLTHSDGLSFTGERAVPGKTPEWIWQAHLARYRFAQRFCDGASVVDLACGSGYGTRMLIEGGAQEVVGLDISSEALGYAAGKFQDSQARFIWTDLEDTITDNELLQRFDVAVAFEAIEHLVRPKVFLANVFALLRPEGRLILSSPDRRFNSPWRRAFEEPFNTFHAREFTRRELSWLLWRYFEIEGRFGQCLFSRVWSLTRRRMHQELTERFRHDAEVHQVHPWMEAHTHIWVLRRRQQEPSILRYLRVLKKAAVRVGF